MFTYEKQDSRIVFTREDNATIIFNNDGTIIGVSGKVLKSKPHDTVYCAFTIAMDGKLEETMDFLITYCEKDLFFNNHEDMARVERLFKIIVRESYIKGFISYSYLERAFECARNLDRIIRNDGYTESNIIKFIQDTHTTYGNIYTLRSQYKYWERKSTFWSTLPPIDYPLSVHTICESILKNRQCTDDEIHALKNAVKNQLIVNLDKFCFSHTSARDYIVEYFDICAELGKTPNLNGNFITKYVEALRERDAIKNDVFAKKQNERPLAFEDDRLMVIVPQTVGELTTEGERQHNCVGNYGYDKDVMKGCCNIVFIRRKDNPEKSYITCEIRDGHIHQYLFAYNCQTNIYDQNENEFRRAYEEYLQSIW